LGIFVLFSRSIFEILSQTGVGYLDSMTALVFFLIVGKMFQNKTYAALNFERNYKSYFPIAVTIIKNGTDPGSLSNLSDLETFVKTKLNWSGNTCSLTDSDSVSTTVRYIEGLDSFKWDRSLNNYKTGTLIFRKEI